MPNISLQSPRRVKPLDNRTENGLRARINPVGCAVRALREADYPDGSDNPTERAGKISARIPAHAIVNLREGARCAPLALSQVNPAAASPR